MERLPITEFDMSEALFDEASEHVSGILKSALEAKGKASLFCAGGSTPGPLYERLSSTKLNWKHITIGLTDERWVGFQAAGSNEAFLRSVLLKLGSEASAARFLPMVTDPLLDPSDEAAHIDAYYRPHAREADCVIVGMGTDGHTLSWFPESEGLMEVLDSRTSRLVSALEARLTNVTGIHTRRVTLTAAAIAHAKNVLLLITGAEKREIYLSSADNSPTGMLRAAAANRLKVYWSP